MYSYRNVQRFRCGLVSKAHRLCVPPKSRLESNEVVQPQRLGSRCSWHWGSGGGEEDRREGEEREWGRERQEVTSPLASTRPHTRLYWGYVIKWRCSGCGCGAGGGQVVAIFMLPKSVIFLWPKINTHRYLSVTEKREKTMIR